MGRSIEWTLSNPGRPLVTIPITGGVRGDLTVTVDSTHGFDDSGVLLIDDERMQYASKDDTSFTVAQGGRGYAGTTAAAHSDNALVEQLNRDWVDVKPGTLPLDSDRIKLKWEEY